MPPGPRSVGCERVTDPRGQPDPAKPHCGFWCATGPAPMAHRGLGVLWGCGGAQGVASCHVVDHQVGDWRAAQPPLGSFCNPSSRPWRLRTVVTPGGGPQVPHAPRGVLGVLWGACMAALALKSPLGNFLAR